MFSWSNKETCGSKKNPSKLQSEEREVFLQKWPEENWGTITCFATPKMNTKFFFLKINLLIN